MMSAPVTPRQVFDKEGSGYVDPVEVAEAAENIRNDAWSTGPTIGAAAPFTEAEIRKLITEWAVVPETQEHFKDINTVGSRNRYG